MNSVVVGLTGQTGAGKSTVSTIMRELSCAVINADSVAREVTAVGSESLKRLAEKFGCDIINIDGSCNRKLLAKRAFSSKENTSVLNAITHPIIIEHTKKIIADFKKKNADIIIFDAPQLFESGAENLCDYIISVTAPQDIRLQRIMKRDSITREDALLRMNIQYDENYYISRSDFIIDGSLSIEKVESQTERIIYRIRKKDGGV